MQMIAAALVLSLVAVSHGQRSPYLGSSNAVYPGVLPRYTTTPPPGAGGSTDLGDRLGGGEQRVQGPVFADGTLYDQETLDRIATWPKEKQPYWYVNRQQIASHRGDPAVQQRPQSTTTARRNARRA